jgi:hypothetical protein
MAEITFYRQKRRDGGLHTGITINGWTAMEMDEGINWDDADPVLLWFVDVRCEGKKLPTRPELARRWLLEHSELIREGFKALTEELRVGIDYNTLPLVWLVPKTPRGVRIRIVCHAMYRSDALTLAQVTAEFSSRWQEWLDKLPVAQEV